MTTPANLLSLGGGCGVEIFGDLFVRGTEHIVDTDNLRIKDPVIAMGAGNKTANSNGGIAIISGSTNAGGASGKADLVLGRIANDTWGAGVADTQSGSITSLTGMGLANMRVRTLQISGSDNVIKWGGVANNAMLFEASSSIGLEAHGGLIYMAADNTLSFNGTTNTMKIGANGGNNMNVNAPGDVIFNAGGGNVSPSANDGAALGVSGTGWSDLFLADGAVINVNGGNSTLTGGSSLWQSNVPVRASKLEVDSAADYLDVDTDFKMVAAADIVLDPGGNDVKVDGTLSPLANNG